MYRCWFDFANMKYEIICTSNKKFFPYYSKIQAAKRDYYSIREAFHVTAISTEMKLQDLLNYITAIIGIFK